MSELPAGQAEKPAHDAHPISASSPAEDEDLQYLSTRQLYAVFGALVIILLMFALDVTVIATAIPKVTDEFHTIKDIGWYGGAYLITTAALQPLTGKVFTHLPLKTSYLVFVGVFELGSLLCGAAKSSTMLIVGRSVAGMGAAGLANGSLTILKRAAPPEKQPMLMSLLMSVFGVGQVLGPIIGGLLTQHATWRWCFYMNLPLGAAAVLATVFTRFPYIPRQKKTWTFKLVLQDFDLIGFCIFAPACIMLLLPLQWGGTEYAWSSATVVGLFCGSAAAFALFALWEIRQEDNAMIPPSVIGQKIVYSASITTFCQFGSMTLLNYYLPVWFQVVQHASPTTSGIHLLPTVITQILVSIATGVLTSRVGFFTPFAVVGMIASTIGAGLMTTFTTTSGPGAWIGYQILNGIGRGMALQQPIQAVQTAVRPSQISIGSATVSWCQTLGGSIALALAQTAFSSLQRHALALYAPTVDVAAVIDAGATGYAGKLNPSQRRQVLDAYNWAVARTYFLAMGLGVVGVLSSAGMGWRRVLRKKKKKEKEEEKE